MEKPGIEQIKVIKVVLDVDRLKAIVLDWLSVDLVNKKEWITQTPAHKLILQMDMTKEEKFELLEELYHHISRRIHQER